MMHLEVGLVAAVSQHSRWSADRVVRGLPLRPLLRLWLVPSSSYFLTFLCMAVFTGRALSGNLAAKACLTAT